MDSELFKRAIKHLVGGVNSPVRSFGCFGRPPVFISRGSGGYIFDEKGKKYLDFCLSFGAAILGHAYKDVTKEIIRRAGKGTSFGACTRSEAELAELIADAFPSVEKVRLTNSGTEAVMGAVRLARAYKNREKIIMFKGSYHGSYDAVLSGRGRVPFNDIESLDREMHRVRRDLAAVLIEPVMANCGVVPPLDGYLAAVAELCRKYGCLLIFDEVVTGFRVSYSGAQGYFGIVPDLTCFGKILGGGLPVGAFGGNKKIMGRLSPEGRVYQAGTFSGNPLVAGAGIETLRALKETAPYEKMGKRTAWLCGMITEAAKKKDIMIKESHIASMFSLSFSGNRFKKFYLALLKNGIYFSPSPFEAEFLSASHSDSDIDRAAEKIIKTLANLN